MLEFLKEKGEEIAERLSTRSFRKLVQAVLKIPLALYQVESIEYPYVWRERTVEETSSRSNAVRAYFECWEPPRKVLKELGFQADFGESEGASFTPSLVAFSYRSC